MWTGYGAHMGWMWLWWIVGLGLLVLLVWAVARAAGSPSPPRGEDSPETILKRRYARGDPVCAMAVASEQGYTKMYGGRDYRFCSRACLDKFEEHPDQYASVARGAR